MESHSIFSVRTTAGENDFWNALYVWLNRPNLLNKHLFGTELIDLGCSECLLHIKTLKEEAFSFKDTLSIRKYFSELKGKCKSSQAPEKHHRYHNYLRLVLTKHPVTCNDYLELVILDHQNNSALFYTNTLGETSYSIKLKCGTIELQFEVLPPESANLVHWCSTVLLPRLKQWAENPFPASTAQSLTLVSICDYKTIYNYLKEKYVPEIKKIWTEVTDPDKFIHEDVAIASYLLLIWKNKCQRFVDLGCGNGLLVYILSSESHQGVGYDVRKRKIWDKYPSSVDLRAEPIYPSKDLKFPQVDWIIGNHSDELTPWIPVIAALSSYECNFFLLPCCPHEFNGSKFKRINSSLSPYCDYLNFIEEMCKTFGFVTKRDKLRIPSTKRVSLLSEGRNYPPEELISYEKVIDSFIHKRCPERENEDRSCRDWNLKVKIRESEERVNNCTQLDGKVKDDILNAIAQIICPNIGPKGPTILSNSKDHLSNFQNSQSSEKSDWFEGVATPLTEIVSSLHPELLKNLKKESKGLQTFIKNHHHIFKLQNGRVLFRKPIEKEVDKKNWKKRDCWFFKNHIHSCPLEDSKCSYIHK